MLTIKRAAVIIVTFVVAVIMTYVPPWKKYDKIHRTDVGRYVLRQHVACYAWYDQPPMGNLPEDYYSINYEFLENQILLTGLIGAALSYGRNGAIVYVLSLLGGYLGMYATNLIMPVQTPHSGWISPIWILIIGLNGLMGFAAGLTLSFGIVSAMSPLPKPRKRPHQDIQIGIGE